MNNKSKRTMSEKSENDFRKLRELFIRRMFMTQNTAKS